MPVDASVSVAGSRRRVSMFQVVDLAPPVTTPPPPVADLMVVPISSIAACTVVAPRPLCALAYETSPAAGTTIVPVVPPVVPDFTGLVPSQEIAYAPTTAAPARTPRKKCADRLPPAPLVRLNMCASYRERGG